MALLDGYPVFGWAVSMATAENPRGQQLNSYPGLSGLETLDQGLRGRITTVVGRMHGVDAAGLAWAENLLRSYNDGAAHTLTDSFGIPWYPVKLESFEPQGRIMVFSGTGVYHRPYSAKFLHL